MIISQYFNELIIFSFLGWVYESIYCTLKEKTWQNRGFLFGPICPIYGFGATGAVILFGRIIPALTNRTEPPIWQIFLICMIGTAVIEYSTSYVLEKCFHAVWWDYSHVPMNINGRVCLPASLAFGFAGCIIVHFVFPIVYKLEAMNIPLLTELTSLLFMAALTADVILSVSALTDLLAKVEKADQEFNIMMEGATEKAMSAGQAITDKAALTGQMLSDKAKEAATALTDRQKEVMMNVTFRFETPNKVAQAMKESFREIGRKGKEVIASIDMDPSNDEIVSDIDPDVDKKGK